MGCGGGGRDLEEEGDIRAHRLVHFAVQRKLMQHCVSVYTNSYTPVKSNYMPIKNESISVGFGLQGWSLAAWYLAPGVIKVEEYCLQGP